MGLPGRAAGVDRDNALRLPLCNRHIAFPHASKKGARLLLETVLVVVMFTRTFICAIVRSMRGTPVAAPRAAYAHRGIGIKQDRQIGLQISTENPVQL